MKTQTVTNPRTGRKATMRYWTIETRKALELLRSGGAKALSWAMLSDDESLLAMESEQHGDAANNNFALAIFEHGLDWALGLKVSDFIRACRTQFGGRLPSRVTVACTRGGDVYVVLTNGQLW